MDGDTVRVVAMVDTGTTGQLCHLRLGTRTTSKVGISADGSKRGRAGSKVVIGDWLELSRAWGAVSRVCRRTVTGDRPTSGKRVVVAAGLEGPMRNGGNVTAEARDAVVRCVAGLPVDGCHAIVKVG